MKPPLRSHAWKSIIALVGALSIVGTTRSRAGAQELTHLAVVDSANAARLAWARAVAAMRTHADSTARREVVRAANAWPTQSAYVWGNAMLAARAKDTVTALRALRDYADLGLGRDLRADTSVARLLSAPGFAAVLLQHEANRAPLARSRVRATLADSTFWPEGVDVDPRTHRYYVASIRHRTIAEIRPDGTSRELITRDRPDLGAIFGVRFDAARGVLWATTSGVPQTQGYVPADSVIAALLKIRIVDGTIEKRWDLPVHTGGHVLGDLAIGPAGDVYVTDSNEPVLYRLRPGADTLEAIRNPLFHNLQGMAPTPDGKLVYLSDYSHGLLRVDLKTRAVTRLEG